MGRRSFSATTVVLIAVLIGALFMVGRAVIPPPPGPPAPPKQPTASPVNPQAEMQQRKMMMAQMAKAHGMTIDPKTGKPKPVKGFKPPSKSTYNPDSIDVTNSYFQQAQMGETGTKQQRERYEKAKAEQAAARAHNLPSGAAAPTPAPAAAPTSGTAPQVAK